MSDNPFVKNKDINVFEPYVCKKNNKKPIEEIRDLLKDINNDMDDIKKDISYIRSYIKKDMIKKQIEEEELKRVENEYINKPKSWWFS